LAVAIWDYNPLDDEILTACIEQGFKPIPTETVNGPVIMGYACKLQQDT